MIVTCDNCGTKYNLPEAKIPASGAKVKCSKCAHVFKVVPPAPEPDPEPEEDDLLAALGDDPGETPPPEDVGGPADEPADDGLPDDSLPDDDDDDFAGLPDDDDDDLAGLPDDDDFGGLPDDDDDLDGLPDDFDDLPGGDDEPAEEEDDDLDDLFGDDDDMDDDLPFGDDDEEEEDDYVDDDEDEDDGEDEDEDEDDDLEDDEEYEEDEEYEDEDDDFDSSDLGLDGPKDKKSKGGLGGLLKILIPVLVVLLLGGGIWYFKAWTFIPGLGGDETAETPAEQAGEPAEQQATEGGQAAAPDAPSPSSPAEQVKNIGLVKVRQFYVTNEKMTNKLFVIEGNAINNFTIPKELIKVEATLYDGTGKLVAQHSQVAGNTLSLFQLQVMTQEQITEALTSEVGILTNNTFLRPGMDVPFMLVFFDVPETVKEFGVKVVEAKDPPKE